MRRAFVPFLKQTKEAELKEKKGKRRGRELTDDIVKFRAKYWKTTKLKNKCGIKIFLMRLSVFLSVFFKALYFLLYNRRNFTMLL